MDNGSFLTMTVALFAITGSIAIIPIFIATTVGQSGAQRRQTALIATGVYVLAGLIALFVGNAMLGVFGISVAALRVAGMAVVAVIGWHMLNAATPTASVTPGSGGAAAETGSHVHAASNTTVAKPGAVAPTTVPTPVSVGVMPLGFPIYGGPGVLSVVIAWGSGSKPVYVAGAAAILVNAAAIIALDFLAVPITRWIGAEGLLVTEKVFGLIVLAIAVSSMTGALLVIFPGWAGKGG